MLPICFNFQFWISLTINQKNSKTVIESFWCFQEFFLWRCQSKKQKLTDSLQHRYKPNSKKFCSHEKTTICFSIRFPLLLPAKTTPKQKKITSEVHAQNFPSSLRWMHIQVYCEVDFWCKKLKVFTCFSHKKNPTGQFTWAFFVKNVV